jgi:ElaB/YqjD/DUF883 family membrane-anchored ribosome-binding protein
MALPPDEDAIRANIRRAANEEREDLCAEVEAYIAARPFQSVLIALLAGILVGRMIL